MLIWKIGALSHGSPECSANLKRKLEESLKHPLFMHDSFGRPIRFESATDFNASCLADHPQIRRFVRKANVCLPDGHHSKRRTYQTGPSKIFSSVQSFTV